MKSYTIGQLAHAAGVPASTVRYYERAGLLRPDGRTGANYRVYGDTALERLRFIRAAQANGFTLSDIVALLGLRDGTTPPCREVQEIVKGRMADLENRARELRQLRRVLESSLRMCRRAERTGRCDVIERLKIASSTAAPTPSRTPGSR